MKTEIEIIKGGQKDVFSLDGTTLKKVSSYIFWFGAKTSNSLWGHKKSDCPEPCKTKVYTFNIGSTMYKRNIYIFNCKDGKEGALFTQTKIEFFF